MKSETIKSLENAVKALQNAIAAEKNEAKAKVYRGETLLEQIRKRHRELLSKDVKIAHDAAHLSRIENGITDPKLNTLNEIATVLGCHLELVPNT